MNAEMWKIGRASSIVEAQIVSNPARDGFQREANQDSQIPGEKISSFCGARGHSFAGTNLSKQISILLC